LSLANEFSESISNIALHKASDEEDNNDEDSEEEEEEESAPIMTDTPDSVIDASISLVKEGVNFSAALNGSDVRVGIIATRWNNDIISGLSKVSDHNDIIEYLL
jgi:hypothetical protein